jgi:hypothetical protein
MGKQYSMSSVPVPPNPGINLSGGGFDIMSILSSIGGLASGGVGSLVGGLLSAFAGLGESSKETELTTILDKMYKNEDYIKSMPFTKDELFNSIYPKIKQLNTGAADVAAGRIGSALGEAGANVGGGQNFVDNYLQQVAPVLAQGQFASAEALQGLVAMYGQMDNDAKQRLLQMFGLEAQTANQLPSMTDFQAFITNFLQGGNITSTIQGNLSMADYLKNKQYPNQK